jgi:acetolactate synthase I/II/III large subunit
MAEYVGRSPDGFINLVELAETVGAAVYDVNARLNFPNRHLNMSMDKSVFRQADLILTLDVRDWEKSTHTIERTKREAVAVYPDHCEMIEIGFGDIGISKWSMDYMRMPNCALRVLGDTATAIPELTRLCQARGLTKIQSSRTLSTGVRARSQSFTMDCSSDGRNRPRRIGMLNP